MTISADSELQSWENCLIKYALNLKKLIKNQIAILAIENGRN